MVLHFVTIITYIHIYMHTYTHTYIQTNIHTYIHAYIHTYILELPHGTYDFSSADYFFSMSTDVDLI